MFKFWGMTQLGNVSVEGSEFIITITNPELADQEQAVYAFLVDLAPVRIGSSKGPLGVHMRKFQRDVSRALRGEKSPISKQEADCWKTFLADGTMGMVVARTGTDVETPVGKLNVYLSEESELIERYHPALCSTESRQNHQVWPQR